MELLASALGLASLDLLLTELLLVESSGVGVEAEKDLAVAERVLLLDTDTLGLGLALGSAENGLDFGRVDETGDVGVGDEVGGKEEVLLESGRSGGAAVDLVESGEGGRGPDDEATEVSTGGELEKVQGEDGRSLNTRNVAESLGQLLAVDLRVVDDERTTALAVAAATHLTLTGAELLRLGDLLDVRSSTDSLQQLNGSLGLGDSSGLESLGLDDERNLGDAGDAVTTGEEERRNGGGSEGGSGSEAPVSTSVFHSRFPTFRSSLTSGPS